MPRPTVLYFTAKDSEQRQRNQVHAMRIRVGVEYKNPPNRVKDALIRAAQSANNVLPNPPVRVFLVDFADFAVIYEIKFYMGNHARINETNDAVRTNVWYELKRQGITIPFPIRTLQLERKAARSVDEEQAEARAILRGEALFECLSDQQVDSLVKQSHVSNFGRGERVIQEGAEGDSMFVLLRGAAKVSVSKNGSSIPVATLNSGDCFGEMAVMDDAPRSADAFAHTTCALAVVQRDDLDQLMFVDKDLAYDLLWTFVRTLSARLRETNDKIKAFFAMSGGFR